MLKYLVKVGILLKYITYILFRLLVDGDYVRISLRWIMRNYPEVSDIIMIKILFIKPPGKDIFTGRSKTIIKKLIYN